MDITRVAVIGAGTMGRGIVQVVAQHGYPVTMIDRDQAIVDASLASIKHFLDRAVAHERLSADDAGVAMSLIETDLAVEAAADVDLVIEAVPEILELKQQIFQRLNAIASDDTILASNTSSISVTKLASSTDRPGQVVGMHFFNPVPLMPLVEVVQGLRTADETAAATIDFAKRLDKTPVKVNDFPGFVSNRVLMPMINEAIFCLMENVATNQAIDDVMRLGMNHPMGPLALADLIGLDVCLDIMEVLHRDLGDPKYRPCPLLRTMVAAGKLGKKSGEGFYFYE
ncbi:MAG TPA: 3-hydroxybutyryl-CoA dehydrogenase [Thermomicrobiaceae bacterium]|nr:3-hydroxybutyryl-CoA dehydrogenase [Thermomicrobiaceae bacterium]